VTGPEPGTVLRRALVAWGLGHIALGRHAVGVALLATELASIAAVWWLTVELGSSSAYLAPFLAGMAFIAAWAWQAVAAYQLAHVMRVARPPTPERSPAAAIGWLSLPLLVWGSGFWLIGAGAGTPAAVLDAFVTEWSRGELGSAWPAEVRSAARTAERQLGSGSDRFHDVRFAVEEVGPGRARAVGQSIHYERRPSTFLGVFPGSELVPIADERVLALELESVAVELPIFGDIGAVRWVLVSAEALR